MTLETGDTIDNRAVKALRAAVNAEEIARDAEIVADEALKAVYDCIVIVCLLTGAMIAFLLFRR